jgi:hypothetical protein
MQNHAQTGPITFIETTITIKEIAEDLRCASLRLQSLNPQGSLTPPSLQEHHTSALQGLETAQSALQRFTEAYEANPLSTIASPRHIDTVQDLINQADKIAHWINRLPSTLVIFPKVINFLRSFPEGEFISLERITHGVSLGDAESMKMASKIVRKIGDLAILHENILTRSNDHAPLEAFALSGEARELANTGLFQSLGVEPSGPVKGALS